MAGPPLKGRLHRMDLFCIALIALLFLLTLGFVKLCERL